MKQPRSQVDGNSCLSVRLLCRGTSAARRECAVLAAARARSSGSNQGAAGNDTRIGPGNARIGPFGPRTAFVWERLI